MKLNQYATEAFRQDVIKRYPNEACGFIINDDYHSCFNVSEEPEKHFRISGEERFDIEQLFGPIQAIVHSHPYTLEESQHFAKRKYNPVWPSVGDQESFLSDNIPWGIVATDGEGISEITWLDETEIIPLESRKFSWFNADCYALVRDWHRINNNITLPNFTREYGFWLNGQNIIEEGIATIDCLKRYPTEQAIVGDIAIFDTAGTGIVNHLGVIAGTNELYHQWIDRYAEKSRWDHWQKHCKYVVRIIK